jgi:dipeptidyl aminopeptidase/acylaminoacyl peptidase
MKPALKIASILLLTTILSPIAIAQSKRPMTFDDLMSIKRVADAQISPDGKYAAYVVSEIDKNANRGKRSVGIKAAAGDAQTRWITSNGNNDTPRWSRDGKYLAFISSRDGAPQIYLAETQSLLANAGGDNARKATGVPEGVADFIWSPDGKMFAFTTEVYPECRDLKCTAEKGEAAETSKVKAVSADRLLFRHWNSFKRGKRSHLFVVSIDGGDPRDLTPGDYDVPPFSLGDPTAYDFSPDSQEIVFARNTEKAEAVSTNNDLFIVPVGGGEAKRITGNNPGSDTTPRYSPDGRWIAYRSQARNGYEADRFRLMLYDRKTGTSKELTAGFDRWVGEFVWAPDGQQIYIVAEDRGRELIGIASITGDIKPIIEKTASSGITISGDGKTLAFTRSSLIMPTEVFKANADGSGVTQLTRTNGELMAQLDLNAAEDFEYGGALKAKVHGFIVKPPQFDKSKKYPMALLIHGGPQGAWLDNWGYRWNAQMWAARGYVAVLINPHGSTGYGQAFTEQISGDWGGAVYEDLMKGVDHVIKQGYIDPARLGAAGGSYGGYMVNWIMGHTDRFKALVSHAGVYNLTSMYGATEELWFTEWEFKGNPWDNPELYTRWSPHRHVRNFKTPTLVIHGELDYRVPIGEGLQLFTALQRRGVPSKLLYYPDEGHWILKPQNSELWFKTVLDWFDQWLKPDGMTATK